MRRNLSHGSGGFTLIEMVIALVLLIVVVGNLYSLLSSSATALGSQNATFDIDTQARRTMDRITMAIIGAKREDLLSPTGQPYFTSELKYRESLGLDASGQSIDSDWQKIQFTNTSGGEVTWYENPGETNEKQVVFSKNVPPFLKDELENGVDDNANGIIDERGLSFVKDGGSLTVYLTIRRTMPDGAVLSRELHETITCRN